MTDSQEQVSENCVMTTIADITMATSALKGPERTTDFVRFVSDPARSRMPQDLRFGSKEPPFPEARSTHLVHSKDNHLHSNMTTIEHRGNPWAFTNVRSRSVMVLERWWYVPSDASPSQKLPTKLLRASERGIRDIRSEISSC